MANRPNVFAEGRHILPTQDLYITRDKFGSNVPAYNNIYDVWIDFSGKGLTRFINQHTFYDKGGRGPSPGSALALFCSEAVLPGSTIETAEVRGLRQGVVQNYATYRSYPDITLTWYSQQDYYTNDVFNAWMEYISPTRLADSRYGDSTRTRRNDKASFRRLKYPEFYKCNMQITSFSKNLLEKETRLEEKGSPQFPSSITYFVENLFPTNIVASPLAYGKSELVKTSVTFKYEYYYIDRTSRAGETFKVSDSGNNRRTDSMNDARASQGTDNAGRDYDDQDFDLSGIESVR